MSTSEFIFAQADASIDGTGFDPFWSDCEGAASPVTAPCCCCAETSDGFAMHMRSSASATMTNTCLEQRRMPFIAAATVVHMCSAGLFSPLSLPLWDFSQVLLCSVSHSLTLVARTWIRGSTRIHVFPLPPSLSSFFHSLHAKAPFSFHANCARPTRGATPPLDVAPYAVYLSLSLQAHARVANSPVPGENSSNHPSRERKLNKDINFSQEREDNEEEKTTNLHTTNCVRWSDPAAVEIQPPTPPPSTLLNSTFLTLSGTRSWKKKRSLRSSLFLYKIRPASGHLQTFHKIKKKKRFAASFYLERAATNKRTTRSIPLIIFSSSYRYNTIYESNNAGCYEDTHWRRKPRREPWRCEGMWWIHAYFSLRVCVLFFFFFRQRRG